MKILVNPVFDWTTCRLESAERVYDHDGPVTQMKGGGSPPPTPDPNVVSAAQTASNKDTAQYNAALGSGGVTTPLGSSKYTSRVDPTTGATIYDQNISLTPETQAQLDQELAQNAQLNGIAGGMLNRIGDTYGTPLDTSGMPALRSSPTAGAYQTDLNTSGLPGLMSSLGPNYSTSLDTGGAPGLVGSIDTNGLPKLYGADDLTGARKSVEDAVYGNYSSRLDPMWQQREDQLRTRLANQGIVEGSDAWKNAWQQADFARNDAYDQARRSATVAGGDEFTRLINASQGNRAQAFGERVTGGNFTNDARAQAVQEALARGGFQNDASVNAFNANNNARAQGFGEQQAAGAFRNSSVASGNADARAGASQDNAARSQALAEAMALRNMPLNEFSALRNEGPVNVPQFAGYNAPQVAGTDTAGNIWNAYQGNLNVWNAKQGAQNDILGGLMGLGGQLGGAALIAMSDVRAKHDIVHLRDLEPGVGWYEFSYLGDDVRHEGVMAQEYERVDPAAVIEIGGVKHVDYARVARRYA